MGWGEDRRLRRLEAAFADGPPAGRRLEKAAHDYGRALFQALEQDPRHARRLFRDYDARIPDGLYGAGLFPEERFAALASAQDLDVLGVMFEVTTRLGLTSLQCEARDRLADLLGARGDADGLVVQLLRWRDLGVLDRAVLDRALGRHVRKATLSRDRRLWNDFFAELPEVLLPDLFEIHALLGHGADAVRLADTAARTRAALDCCLLSRRVDDARAGLALARREGDGSLTALEEHLAELLFGRDEFEDALPHFRAAGKQGRESECLERLGRYGEALSVCPPGLLDRLEHLAEAAWREIDALVERREYAAAARRAQAVVARLGEAVDPTEAFDRRREELATRREAILQTARWHFADMVERADDGDAVRREWSLFEEGAGEPFAAAEQAQKGGDLYRAHGLYLAAGCPGEAERVLRGEPGSWRERASAREAGGDLEGAAELYARNERLEEAAGLFLRAGRHASAARCLIELHGDEAIEDARVADCLRRSGDMERLVGLCLRAVDRQGRGTAGFRELHRLTAESMVPPHLEPEVRQRLEALHAQGREPFEEKASGWVEQARREIHERYARIWGLDLGTTTSVVALFDGETGQPVLCPWKGRPYFASTLSLDESGNERVGMSGEEILAGWVKGHISAAKRRIGRPTRFRVRDRVYRAEEVAGRLIAHARRMVEDFLAERVLERVTELARAELGEVHSDWLDWLRQEHDLRLDRPQAIVTIPAFFRNNQKQATRDACEVAGVDLVRLIHEPTAACIAAARQRRMSGEVVVVDLGAGTLDISALTVEEDVYEVHQVSGDDHFGGKDLDAVITGALEERLARDGVRVPEKGKDRLRLQIAAETLKVRLSGQREADYPLPGFNGDPDFRLELSRDELVEMLAEPLGSLRRTCEKLKARLEAKPEHLVLVGGPMLAPYVTELIEDVFGLRRTVLSDPRNAVAFGAALQAAVLSGVLRDQLLLDVTPLALGILVSPTKDTKEFSPLIAANTTIPTKRSEIYTTFWDNQDTVLIQVFNGDLRPESKIGEFQLGGIPPLPKGEPQIEVSFSIDANCVLEVTACDTKTGKKNSITIGDTTLLSPGEIREMAERQRAQRVREERAGELNEIRAELAELAEEARRSDGGPLFREFRTLLAGRRSPGARLDAGTERVLAEIYSPASAELEAEVLSMRAPLLDLTSATEEFLNAGRDDLAEAEHLRTELDERLDRIRRGIAQVTLWNGVLTRLAAMESDPLRRFRGHHATGHYARALDSLAEHPAPLDDPEDVRRKLHCLAETGATEDYRRTLIDDGDLVGAVVLDPARPEAFLRHAGPALVRISPGGSGFIISDRLVVTSRHWVDGRTTDEIAVETNAGPCRVGHVFTPDSPHLGVVLLQLLEPLATPPLRLGHAKLVRIGDRVYAADHSHTSLLPGVVDAFEAFPEQDLRLYRTGGLRTPPESAGGPLLNELGEAVGVLTGHVRTEHTGHVRTDNTAEPANAAFTITIDSIARLLASAGYGAT